MTKHEQSSLIIGSTSVLGSAIAESLSDLGHVRTAGRRHADFVFDLADPDVTVAHGHSFDAAVLVASDFGGPTGDDLIRATQVNVVGALAACKLAFGVGVKHFVLISTLSSTYEPGDPYFGSYALSKRQGEEAVSLFCRQHEIHLTILRPTGLYDVEGKCRAHQGLLYGIVDYARAGTDFTIAGSADPLRNYLHVRDLARVVFRVIEERSVGVFPCVHSESLRISEIASLAYEVFGRGGRVRFDPSKADIPATPAAPRTEIYDRLSIWPLITLKEGMRQIRDFSFAGGST